MAFEMILKILQNIEIFALGFEGTKIQHFGKS